MGRSGGPSTRSSIRPAVDPRESYVRRRWQPPARRRRRGRRRGRRTGGGYIDQQLHPARSLPEGSRGPEVAMATAKSQSASCAVPPMAPVCWAHPSEPARTGPHRLQCRIRRDRFSPPLSATVVPCRRRRAAPPRVDSAPPRRGRAGQGGGADGGRAARGVRLARGEAWSRAMWSDCLSQGGNTGSKPGGTRCRVTLRR
jgi:hypothetical protein